jgi:hypothetical protein
MDGVEATSLRFAAAARDLGLACRRRGLRMPGFRSPPRLAGVNRSVRRRPDGGVTVAVRIRGRPFAAVIADMIEGVVVANGLDGEAADRVRETLWSALPGEDRVVAA